MRKGIGTGRWRRIRIGIVSSDRESSSHYRSSHHKKSQNSKSLCAVILGSALVEGVHALRVMIGRTPEKSPGVWAMALR